MTVDPTATLREARVRYFEDNAFGENGGYDEPWVDFKVGPLPFPFPNTPARVRAVAYHDLHHIVTGYATDLTGEFEIAAWELGAGCKDFAAAWVLNLAGIGGGICVAPRRMFRAFVLGRASRSMYGDELEALLPLTVAEARRRYLGDEARAPHASKTDALLFVGSALAGAATSLAFLALAVPLAPVGLVTNAWRKRSLAPGPSEASRSQRKAPALSRTT